MNSLFFNNASTDMSFANKDILAVFNTQKEKPSTIEEGMTVEEISDVVSDRIMDIINKQFEETKKEFEAKTKASDSEGESS